MKSEHIILIPFLLLTIYLFYKFINGYIDRIKFLIFEEKIFYIKNDKKIKICSIFDISDIFLSSYSVGCEASTTSYNLYLINKGKTIFNLSNEYFYISDVKKLYKNIKKKNPNIKYTKYDNDSFLNMFDFYKNRNLLKDKK